VQDRQTASGKCQCYGGTGGAVVTGNGEQLPRVSLQVHRENHENAQGRGGGKAQQEFEV
jgi:hypothetical protein